MHLKKIMRHHQKVWFAVNSFLAKTYWSSGFGSSAGSFGWCTVNTTVDAALWKKGEPGAATGCVIATFPKIPKNATGGENRGISSCSPKYTNF
jgi:hypothetical protein